MDPPTTSLMMMNENSTTPFNLQEIWPIPMNGDRPDLRTGPFGPIMGRFMDPGPDRDGSDAAPRKRRENGAAAEDESAKGVCTGMSDSDGKRLKTSGSGDENQNPTADGEASSGKEVDQKNKPPPEPPKDYIHVRARRGQATDSHSLAERARREKISERMRILQDLVPGCNKVIGKALVLDEIINYIQSLQRQVEFLSMKLEAVNTRVTPGIEAFPVKDFGQQAFDTPGVVYGSQPPREYGRGSSPDWLHMQVGGGFERQT